MPIIKTAGVQQPGAYSEQDQLSFWEMSLLQKASTSAKWLGHQIARAWMYIFTFEWAEGLLSWLILSAGTLSGCIFFLSGLWFMVDASVHPFIEAIVSGKLIELFKSGHTDIVLSWLATTAFTGLPEFLLPLATYTVFKHFKTWRYTKQNEPLIWFWLFVIPAVLFLIVTVVTLGFSIASDGMTNLDLTNLNVEALAKSQFTLPMWIVVPRGIVAFFYGFFSLIYPHIGKPSEVDRLREKDDLIAQLRQDMVTKLAELQQEKDKIIGQLQQELTAKLAQWQQEKDDLILQFQTENTSNLASLGSGKDATITQLRQQNQSFQVQLDGNKREIDRLNELLSEYKTKEQQLINTINRGSDEALQQYSEECIAWLKGNKSATVEDIVRFTGHPKRKIEAAIGKQLQLVPRSKEGVTRVLMTSLIPWLKITPAPTISEPKTEPALHIVTR